MLVKFSDGAISPSDIEVGFRRGSHPDEKDWATALFAIPSQKVAVTIPGLSLIHISEPTRPY